MVATLVATEPPYRFDGVLPRVQPVTLAFTAYVGNGVPDTMGAVGPRQFLLVTNNRIKSFNKETGQADAVVDLGLGTFFRTVAHAQIGIRPNVRYDRRANKWLVGAISAFRSSNGSNRLVFAVSDSGVLSSATRWTFFQFQFDQPEPAGNTGCSAGLPRLGPRRDRALHHYLGDPMSGRHYGREGDLRHLEELAVRRRSPCRVYVPECRFGDWESCRRP